MRGPTECKQADPTTPQVRCPAGGPLTWRCHRAGARLPPILHPHLGPRTHRVPLLAGLAGREAALQLPGAEVCPVLNIHARLPATAWPPHTAHLPGLHTKSHASEGRLERGLCWPHHTTSLVTSSVPKHESGRRTHGLGHGT